MEQISRIGMDTSKHIFQLHGVNTAEEPVLRKELRRKEMFAFLEKSGTCLLALARAAPIARRLAAPPAGSAFNVGLQDSCRAF